MKLRFTARVVDRDRGWRNLRAAAVALKGARVRAGLLAGPDNDRTGGALTNAEVGIVHEFGSPAAGIPERSFVRSAYDAGRAKYLAMLDRFLDQVYRGAKVDWRQALGLIGARMAADMKAGITAGGGIPPPLAPETVSRKGSTRPLVDTGQLINALTWLVDKVAT